MGRKGSGVEARGSSIRLSFTVNGQQHRHTLRGDDGKPLAPTPANLRHAERVAAQIRRDLELGRFEISRYFPDQAPTDGAITLAKHLEAWLEAQRLQVTTRAGYAAAVRFWTSAPADKSGAKLGQRLLLDLKAGEIAHALAARADLAPRSQTKYLMVLRQAVRAAVVDEIIAKDVTATIKAQKGRSPEPDPFTADELEAILTDMREHCPEPVLNVFEFWGFTGMRTAELIGLQWPSVDLASGRALVHETMIRGRHKDSTKTGAPRLVLLNSRALAALQRQRAHSQMAGGFVWTTPGGVSWGSDMVLARWWRRTLTRTGIRYRQPYALRHTYATALLMAGVNPAFGAKQLGHSVMEFLSTYSRWMGGDADARELQRLEAAMQPAPTKKTRRG
jgi:integrase